MIKKELKDVAIVFKVVILSIILNYLETESDYHEYGMA